METEEDEEFCNNCKRPVSSKNFATHSAFCERNIFVCKICDEPVQIAEKNQHLEEYHVILPCDLCELPLEKWMQPKHVEKCPKRLIKCDYCEAEYSFDEISGHMIFCGSKTEKCMLCQKYVMIKDKADHDKLHVYEHKYHTKGIEEVKQNRLNEVICNNIYEKQSRAKCGDLSFEKGTASRPGSKMREEADAMLPDKSRSKATQEDRNSENPTIEGAVASLPIKSKEKSKHYGECHICKQLIPWIDMNIHIPSCASSAGKCSVCGEHVPSHEIKLHMMEHFQNKSPQLPLTIPQNDESCFKPNTFTSIDSYVAKSKITRGAIKCPYCSLYCSEERILDHSRNCLKNIYECPLCKEKIPEKDKIRHETSDCVMIHERESNRYSFSRSSSEGFYECPLCFENVPEENRDAHASLDCKNLLNSDEIFALYMTDDSFDTYQCPLCLENMLKKDKVKHESFECRVLIESNGIQIPGQTYADVTKKTCGDNCKSKQNCSEICRLCKNRIPQHKLSEHKKNCQRMKVPCVLCNQMIDAACEEMHLRSCPGFSNHKSRANQTYSTPKDEYKGAKPKNASIKDMLKPQVSKCKHCQTTLNADIVMYHEEECVHRPIECPDCFKSILAKDFADHRCKTKKGKGKNSKTKQLALEVEKDQPSIKKKIWNFFSQGNEKEEEKYAGGDRMSQYSFHSDDVRGNQHQNFSGIDDTLIPCEFCHRKFPASDIVLHETGCQPDLVSYAKTDSSKDSKLSKLGPKEDSGLLPSRSSSVVNDSGRTGKPRITHTSNVNDPFFANTKSFLPTSKFEHIRTKTESNVNPGEFLMPLHNTSTSKNYKHPIKEKKKVEPFKLHSVWGAKISNDFEVEDDSNQISDHSDVEMGVEVAEESTYSNEKERSSKGHVEEISNEIDSEMTTIMDFLGENKNTEFVNEYENISVVNDKAAVSKSLGTEGYSILDSDLLSGDIEEKQGEFILLPYRVQKDLLLSKKTTVHEESENMYRESSKSIDNTVEEQKEYVSNFRQHLADFKFNSFKTSSEDSAHHTILPEKGIESEKLYKQEPLRKVDSSKHKEDVGNYKQLLSDFKFGVSESSIDNVHHAILSEKNDELKKLYKQTMSRNVDSTTTENDVNNYKQLLPDFKYGAHESSVDNVHCTILPGKNAEPEKLYKQKISRNVDSTKGEKDLSNYKQVLPNFKFGAHESSEDNVNCTILPEKNAEPEELYKQNTLRYTDSTKNERDLGHLPDFKFDIKQTKSLSSENMVLHEKKSGYHDNHAFKLEPVLLESDRSTVQEKSEKTYENASRHIDNVNKDDEECNTKKMYMPDLKFGSRVIRSLSNEDNVHSTTVSDEKLAFKIEPAESLLKEEKLTIQMTRDKERKEINDLDEKIAKLHNRNFVADVDINDNTKWKKWRDRKPSSSSSDDSD